MEPTTLSVNPGEKTLGTLLKAPAIGALRYRGMVDMSDTSGNCSGLTNKVMSFLFPVRKVGSRYSMALLSVRVLAAGVALYGCLNVGVTSGESLLVLVCAVMLACGLLGRLAAGALSVVQVIELINGSVSLESGVLMCGVCAILCVAGPGWFSIDAWLRSQQVKLTRRNHRRVCRERMASVGL